jgi:hypothetical protein
MKKNFLVFLFLSIPVALCADAGIPMLAINETFLLFALIPVIIIEAFLLMRFGLDKKVSIKAVIVANLVSTVIGYPLAWILMFGLEMLLYALKNIHLPDVITFIFSVAWLGPMDEYNAWLIPVASIIGLIPAYFISVYSEYFIIGIFFKETDKKTLLRYSWIINSASYALLLLIAVIFIFVYYKPMPNK